MAPAAVAAAFIVEYCIVSSQSRKLRSPKSLTVPVGSSEVSSAHCTLCMYVMYEPLTKGVRTYVSTYVCTYYCKVKILPKRHLLVQVVIFAWRSVPL